MPQTPESATVSGEDSIMMDIYQLGETAIWVSLAVLAWITLGWFIRWLGQR